MRPVSLLSLSFPREATRWSRARSNQGMGVMFKKTWIVQKAHACAWGLLGLLTAAAVNAQAPAVNLTYL